MQMPGDGWRDAHDYIASSTVFDLVSLAGISGTMLHGAAWHLQHMAVPAEVLAAALAEDGSRRSRPGAVPDYCFTVDGRCMLHAVRRKTDLFLPESLLVAHGCSGLQPWGGA